MNWKIVGAGLSGLAIFGGIIVSLYLLHAGLWAAAEALSAALVGVGTGWILGIFLSPYDRQERARFGDIGKTVSAVAGGAAATQLINILVKAVDKGLLWTGAFWHPFLLGLAALFAAWAITYVSRTYW